MSSDSERHECRPPYEVVDEKLHEVLDASSTVPPLA